jgi:hypothetical protein
LIRLTSIENASPQQPGRDAHRHHTLEYPAQGIAFSEAFAPRKAEYRVIGNPVFDTELAEQARFT